MRYTEGQRITHIPTNTDYVIRYENSAGFTTDTLKGACGITVYYTDYAGSEYVGNIRLTKSIYFGGE